MKQITITQKQARQFAIECFDAIIRDIKAKEEREKEESSDESSCDVLFYINPNKTLTAFCISVFSRYAFIMLLS